MNNSTVTFYYCPRCKAYKVDTTEYGVCSICAPVSPLKLCRICYDSFAHPTDNFCYLCLTQYFSRCVQCGDLVAKDLTYDGRCISCAVDKFDNLCRQFMDALSDYFSNQQLQYQQTSQSIEPIATSPTVDVKGYVYLLKHETLPMYKIGKSKSPVQRIDKLEVNLPFPIDVIHLIQCENRHHAESTLHARYASKRVRGEWFALTDEDVTEIKSITRM